MYHQVQRYPKNAWTTKKILYPARLPCISVPGISCNSPGFRSNLGLFLLLDWLFSCGTLLFATWTGSVSKTSMNFSLPVFFMTGVAWFNLLSFLAPQFMIIFFLLGMRTCYDEMPTIHHAPSEIMSKLSKWKVRILSILILYCPKSLLTNPHGVFAALLLPVIYEINTKTLGTSFPACLLACFGLGSVLQARSPTTYRKVPIFEKGKLSKVYCQCTAAYQVQTRSKYHFTTKHSKVNETQSSSFFLGLL